MGKFSTITVHENQFKDDAGVRVSRMLSLIEGSLYEKEIKEHLSVERYEKEIISIKGASTLVRRLEEIKDKFTKFDVLTTFDKVSFPVVGRGVNKETDDVFRITFDDDKNKIIKYPSKVDEEVEKIIEKELATIQAEPIYDSLRQVFSKLFRFEPYGSKLLLVYEPKRVEIVDTNLRLLKEYYTGKKLSHRYRMLRENSTGLYFFRALISSSRYQDYNVGVSVFIALLSMHKVMQEHKSNYVIRKFSYTESKVVALLENTKGERIDNIGEVRFQVLLTNSETTKGAVKLSGMYAIVVEVNGKKISLEGKQSDDNKRFKDGILSISHGSNPETSINKMNVAANLRLVETRLYEEIRKIKTARQAEDLKKIFKARLETSKLMASSDASAAELNTLFNQQANSFGDLLKIMGKAQLIIEQDDMETKDALKYIVHDVLFGPRTGPRPQDQDQEETDNDEGDDD